MSFDVHISNLDSHKLTKILKRHKLDVETLNWEDLLDGGLDFGSTSGAITVELLVGAI